MEIKVRYDDFEKSYFMDLLLASGLMVETKTVEALNEAHQAQTLHYLLLSGMRHGLLINLRSNKVQKRYVSTTLDVTQRQRFVVHDIEWQAPNESSRRLRSIFLELLADWGAFLQTCLYREAIIHFFGGPSSALQRINIYDGNAELATHEMCLISNDTAVVLTARKDGKNQMKNHLQKLLSHTDLLRIQWLNMNNRDIEFRTVAK